MTGMINATDPGHRLADIARDFRPRAEFLRQSAISGRAAPSDPPRRAINTLEECVLLAEVQLEPGKIRLLSLEIALHGGDRLGDFGGRRGGLGAGDPAQQKAFGRLGAFGRQLEARDA